MGHLAVMQVQKVWRAVVRLQHSQILGSEMSVACFAWQDGKEKTEVGVVAIQQIQLSQI